MPIEDSKVESFLNDPSQKAHIEKIIQKGDIFAETTHSGEEEEEEEERASAGGKGGDDGEGEQQHQEENAQAETNRLPSIEEMQAKFRRGGEEGKLAGRQLLTLIEEAEVYEGLQEKALHGVGRFTVCKPKSALTAEELKQPLEKFCRRDVFVVWDSGHSDTQIDYELAVALGLIQRGAHDDAVVSNASYEKGDIQGEYIENVKFQMVGRKFTAHIRLGGMHPTHDFVYNTVLVPDREVLDALVYGGKHGGELPGAVEERLRFTRVVPAIWLGVQVDALAEWTSHPTHYSGYNVVNYKEMGAVLMGRGPLPHKWTKAYREALDGKVTRSDEETEKLFRSLYWRASDEPESSSDNLMPNKQL